ncbi:MAG: hypothetical protein SGCHY_002982 [Lobulomycetales sp.]
MATTVDYNSSAVEDDEEVIVVEQGASFYSSKSAPVAQHAAPSGQTPFPLASQTHTIPVIPQATSGAAAVALQTAPLLDAHATNGLQTAPLLDTHTTNGLQTAPLLNADAMTGLQSAYMPKFSSAAAAPSYPDNPPSARLFIGNLRAEKTSPEELSRIFSPYGSIHEISLKGKYGFVQFDSIDECSAAISGVQGRVIGGAPLDLKYSKERPPQPKPPLPVASRHSDSRRDRRDSDRRRSRSPRRSSHDDRSRDRSHRHRSRSPERSRRHYSSSSRRRSRSRSPSSRREGHLPSGKMIYSLSDSRILSDLQIEMQKSLEDASGPHRRQEDMNLPVKQAPNVPHVVIICFSVDKSFVKAVETAYVDAGFSVENVFLSHRFSASAVVRQRRAEGAKAIVYLDKYGQRHDVINMSSFYDSTRITDWSDIRISEGVKIALRERNSHMARDFNPVSVAGAGSGLQMQAMMQILQQQQQQRHMQQFAQNQPGSFQHMQYPPQQQHAFPGGIQPYAYQNHQLSQQRPPQPQQAMHHQQGSAADVGDILGRLRSSMAGGSAPAQNFGQPRAPDMSAILAALSRAGK